MTIIKARFNQGRWIADCPDCQGAELSHPGLDFVCLSECSEEAARQFRKEGKPITAENSNELIARMWKISRTFRRYQVEFPVNKTEIEEALEHRAFPEWRSWEWGMTVQELIDAEPFLHHSWTAPRTWVAGETVTAAIGNVHWRDNLNATAVAVVTTKGDLAVATASVTLTRLAVGANGDILTADSAATPGVRWSGTGKTASGGVGRNVNITNTLTAAANNDQLEQARITGVFAKSTFTGLTVMQLYIQTAGATATGAGIIDDFYGIYINGAPTLGTTNWTLYSADGNMVLAAASGKIFIGDTANANMTTGLTINQGAADNEILAMKSSDVAHGGFSVTETDNFGLMKKVEGANGGLDIQGFGDGEFGAMLTGYVSTIVTTKATSSNAQVVIRGADNTANSNILAVQVSGWTTRFILDADGDSHQDVGTAWTNFDRENDIDLLNTLAAHVTRKDDPLRRGFGKWLRERRGRLEELKLVTFNRDGHHFVNMSRLTMLHTGALRELGAKLEAQAERLLLLEKKVLQLSA